jgi:hypothetical protein
MTTTSLLAAFKQRYQPRLTSRRTKDIEHYSKRSWAFAAVLEMTADPSLGLYEAAQRHSAEEGQVRWLLVRWWKMERDALQAERDAEIAKLDGRQLDLFVEER